MAATRHLSNLRSDSALVVIIGIDCHLAAQGKLEYLTSHTEGDMTTSLALSESRTLDKTPEERLSGQSSTPLSPSTRPRPVLPCTTDVVEQIRMGEDADYLYLFRVNKEKVNPNISQSFKFGHFIASE